ncbi:RDD family protein [Cognatiyoonia koreensis]|uniref:RDD family protein n=2 Tax=Cognatiyoonia koreensis TaxID=364200 RepID=A0A1I0NU30_9RHOB|nr:RDD family protein [Cognatiyoonia koreensis]
MTSHHLTSGLPDPQTEAAFYEGVPLKRFIAWVVDAIVITLFSLIAVPFTAFTAIFYFPFMMLFVGFIYRWGTIASRSSTWGMRLMAIEFRNDDGHRFDSGEAALHTLGYTVAWAVFPLQLVSMVMMCVTERGQGLIDTIMHTTAINKPA